MVLTPPRTFLLLSISLQTCSALNLGVARGSPCESVCSIPDGNLANDAGAWSQLCSDGNFDATTVGRKSKECINCLKKSNYVNGTDSDLATLLYNLRFTLNECLVSDISGLPETLKNEWFSRDTLCDDLRFDLGFDTPDLRPTDKYKQCTASKVDEDQTERCSALLGQYDRSYLANFMGLLVVACSIQPGDGSTLSATADLFEKGPSDNSAPPSEARPTDNVTEPPEEATKQKFPRGAIIGIVFGVSALFGLAGALFIIYFRNERKYRREAEERRRGSLLMARLSGQEQAYSDWPLERLWGPRRMTSRDLFDNEAG